MSSQFAGFTAASPLDDDNLSVIGFANRPDLDRVLGSTSFTLDVVSGQIVESDIFLNSTFAWSVAADGQAGAYDVESIALHEIGHLHGLGHSALGETQLMGTNRLVLAAEAVMFPVAFSAGSVNCRTLRADDIAGISDLYGNDTFRHIDRQHQRTHHEERRRCLRRACRSPSARRPARWSEASRSRYDGNFVIAGLDPGPQVVRVEPLDDADIDSFFDSTSGRRRRFQAGLLHASGRRAAKGAPPATSR